MRPKKSLGQNFLINQNAARRIASCLELRPGDTALEIGGGRGDLTCHLVDSGAQVMAVELDNALVEGLRSRFRDATNLRVLHDSILDIRPADAISPATEAKLVGNIPYNLTSPIIEWIVEHRSTFPLVVLMVQKEVGQRLAANPGGKDFGSLTIFVQLFFNVKRVFTLRPGSFFPKPKVDSAVIRLERLPQPHIVDSEYADLRRLTSACFRWRRKTIVRILREEYRLDQQAAVDLLTSLALTPAIRPEQLAVTDFVALMRKLKCVFCDSP